MPHNVKGTSSTQNSGRIRLIGAMRAPVTFEDFVISLSEPRGRMRSTPSSTFALY